MQEIVENLYHHHQMDHQATSGIAMDGVTVEVMVVVGITDGTTMHKEAIMQLVHRIVPTTTMDMDKVVVEVEIVEEDQVGVIRMDGNPLQKTSSQSRKPRKKSRFHHCWY